MTYDDIKYLNIFLYKEKQYSYILSFNINFKFQCVYKHIYQLYYKCSVVSFFTFIIFLEFIFAGYDILFIVFSLDHSLTYDCIQDDKKYRDKKQV